VLRARNILIVDDSASVRGVLRSLIDTQDDLVVCGEAVDGLDAIARARYLKPDLILLDLAMPKLNGAATASILKRMMPQIAIILFTMYEDAVQTLGLHVGVDVVLAKPDGISNLLPRVRQLFASRSNEPGFSPA
jgi:DNA-binding NarL/FixJ family response regulator